MAWSASQAWICDTAIHEHISEPKDISRVPYCMGLDEKLNMACCGVQTGQDEFIPHATDIGCLIKHISMGNKAAFVELHVATSKRLYGICFRILREHTAAEDALQIVYLKIWQKAGCFSSRNATPMSWISSIAKHSAIDLLRRRHRANFCEWNDDDIADEAPSPEQILIARQKMRKALVYIAGLDRQSAAMILNAATRQLTYAEHAVNFGMPMNTFKSKLSRIRRKVREKIDPT